MMTRDMLGRKDAISVDEARRILDGLSLPLSDPESVPVETACGRVICDDIVAPEDIPEFARSTMDGYAVRSSDTFGCSESLPAYLRLMGAISMGTEPKFSLGAGGAASIPTGGMLPDGADAVVMLEHVHRTGDDMIEVLRPVAPAENVVLRGEDITRGQVVLQRGDLLRPQDVGALAGLGIAELRVYGRPVVGIISTGDEVVSPGSELKRGQVRDINSYTLSGLIREAGAVARVYGIFPDVLATLRDAVENAVRECALVLISGGSSVGARDMAARVMEELEPGSILFHGVAIKPGKPLIASLVMGTPVFGLPGHPVAVAVSFLNFVEPLLYRMGGRERRRAGGRQGTVRARLAKNVASAAGREDHIRVALREQDDMLLAVPVLSKSGLIRSLVDADGMIVIPADVQGAAKGAIVNVRLFQ